MLMNVCGGMTYVLSPRLRGWGWKPVDLGMKTMDPYRRRVSYWIFLASVRMRDVLNSRVRKKLGPYHHSEASL